METLIMHPETKEQLNVLKAIAKALKISVETYKSLYNQILWQKSKKQRKEGIIERWMLMMYGAV